MRPGPEVTFNCRGWIGCAVLVPAGLVSLFSPPVVRIGSEVGWVLDFLAFGVFISGAALRLWATLYIGGHKCKDLVRNGPYSLCRNPLYIGSLLIGCSSLLFLKTPWFAVGLGVMAAFYGWATIPAEEKKLREVLGSEYLKYCQEVPSFIPDFSRFSAGGSSVELDLHALKSEAKRALWWIWLPMLGMNLTKLRSEDWWPSLF